MDIANTIVIKSKSMNLSAKSNPSIIPVRKFPRRIENKIAYPTGNSKMNVFDEFQMEVSGSFESAIITPVRSVKINSARESLIIKIRSENPTSHAIFVRGSSLCIMLSR